MQKEYYAELLRSPLWQKKRLEIMQRDNFTCCKCGSSDKELQVHHIKYRDGLKPWEYEDYELITLCNDCHNEEHGIVKKIKPQIGEVYKLYHGDSENLMLCYSVNYSKKKVYLLGLDDLSSTNTTWFEAIPMDVFEYRCILYRDFWDYSFSDENYWQEQLCRSLVDLYTEYKFNRMANQIFNGFTYTDGAVKDYARGKVVEIVNKNRTLYELFSNILNEYKNAND